MRVTWFVLAMCVAAPARADEHRITVRVRGDSDVRLEEATVANDASVSWETSCISPCFTHVAPHTLVRANAALPSEPLKLGDDDAVLYVERGKAHLADTSTALIAIGATLFGVGGVAAPIAGVLLLQDSILCFDCSPRDHATHSAVFAGSIVTAATGLAILFGGLLIRPSARARVSLASLTYKW
jgi:hypothetical protein